MLGPGDFHETGADPPLQPICAEVLTLLCQLCLLSITCRTLGRLCASQVPKQKLLLKKAKLLAKALLQCWVRGASVSNKFNPLLPAALIIALMRRDRTNQGRSIETNSNSMKDF